MKHRVFLCGLAAHDDDLLASVAEDRIRTATPIKHLVVSSRKCFLRSLFRLLSERADDAGETPVRALATTSKAS